MAESKRVAIARFWLQSNSLFVSMAFGLRIIECVLAKNFPDARFVMQIVEQGFCVSVLSCGASEIRIRLPDDHAPLREDRCDDFVEIVQ